jgi:hypothetical protein
VALALALSQAGNESWRICRCSEGKYRGHGVAKTARDVR